MIEIPKWLAAMPKKASVNIKEFADILGIDLGAMRSRVYQGRMGMPKPDFNSRVTIPDEMGRVPLAKGLSTGKGKNYWKAVTVRNYIRYLNRKELEESK
jgi:hypothetical protein